MARMTIVLLLIIIASLLIFNFCDKNLVAQEADRLEQVLENQKQILQKLDAMDKKLDVIKIRIKL